MKLVNITKSLMILYTNGFNDPYSHVVKTTLAKKCLEFEEHVMQNNMEVLKKLNQHCYTPSLLDRDLILYKTEIITEYIDERFPHPPLLPINPILKAKTRLFIYRINQDWFKTLNYILNLKYNISENLEKYKLNLIFQTSTAKFLFNEMPYFLSKNFSLIDCGISTLFWYITEIDKDFLKREKIIHEYSKKIFTRDSIQKMLSKK